MSIIAQEYAVVGVDEVRPHPDNPRLGVVVPIERSIDVNGFYGTIIAQRSTGFIVVGNHRWQAARASGMTEVPVLWADIDADTARRIMIADNRTSDNADWDDQLLASLLSELGSLDGTGYSDDELTALLPSFDIGDAPAIPLDAPKVHECPSCLYRWILDAQHSPVAYVK